MPDTDGIQDMTVPVGGVSATYLKVKLLSGFVDFACVFSVEALTS